MAKTIRKTKQKEVIKKILCNTTSHPTADWIYEEARKELPNISLGTVYRNLSIMKDSGEILELDFGSSFSRFDGNPEPHYHFRCTQCSNVYDIELQLQKEINADIENAGFEVKGHRLELYGICPTCKTD